jgi:hypothetical protein
MLFFITGTPLILLLVPEKDKALEPIRWKLFLRETTGAAATFTI